MSLSAAAERLRADRAEALNRCPVGQLRLTLSDEQRDELDDLMRQDIRAMPSRIVIEAIKNEWSFSGPISDTAMQSHRRSMAGGRGCKCQG